MSQFGINSAANLDNPLPGISEPRNRPLAPAVRKEESPHTRREPSDSNVAQGQTETASRRRVDFYA
ncbi:MAG: hypothetical protein ACYC9S_08495 [Leptospirales bacterium]